MLVTSWAATLALTTEAPPVEMEAPKLSTGENNPGVAPQSKGNLTSLLAHQDGQESETLSRSQSLSDLNPVVFEHMRGPGSGAPSDSNVSMSNISLSGAQQNDAFRDARIKQALDDWEGLLKDTSDPQS